MKYAFCLCVFLVACKVECKAGGEDVDAKVNCKINQDVTVECVVKQDKGTSEVEVCWDFAASCPNGSTLKAERTCQKVKDGGSATTTIPADKIKLAGPTCDANPTATLTNLTINGKAATN